MVGNGTYLQAEGIINFIPLHVQTQLIWFPAHALPISGADIILGVINFIPLDVQPN